jgi:hypothetical protein
MQSVFTTEAGRGLVSGTDQGVRLLRCKQTSTCRSYPVQEPGQRAGERRDGETGRHRWRPGWLPRCGATKASEASRRMWRSTLPSRRAIAAKSAPCFLSDISGWSLSLVGGAAAPPAGRRRRFRFSEWPDRGDACAVGGAGRAAANSTVPQKGGNGEASAKSRRVNQFSVFVFGLPHSPAPREGFWKGFNFSLSFFWSTRVNIPRQSRGL